MEKRKLTVGNNGEQQIHRVSAVVEKRQGVLSFSLEGNDCLEDGGIAGGCPDGVAVEKGSESMPYTVAEYEKMCVDGSWSGGFVENLGLIEAQSASSGTSGTYYSDWDFDIEEVKNDSYRKAKYEGSRLAKDNNKDCAYRCIANYLKGVNSIGVSDLYGDWLKNIKGVADKDVSPAVANGLVMDYMVDFLNFVLPKLGKKLVRVYEKKDKKDIMVANPELRKTDGHWDMMGTVEKVKGVEYHEIIVYGKDDSNNGIIYADPQNPYNRNEYRFEDLTTLYEIRKEK